MLLSTPSIAHAAGFFPRYELSGETLPAGVSILDISIDGRAPRYPETFVSDMDGDGLPEFVAFPGGFEAGQCRPLLIALSTVRGNDDIDSSDSRYITISDANGTVPDDSFCTDAETFDAIGDMNGDGFGEFALYSRGTHVIQGVQTLSGEVRLEDHDGISGFVVRDALLRRTVGDLDGDGMDELALTEFSDTNFSLGSEYILRGRADERPAEILAIDGDTDDVLATIITGSENFGLVLPLGDVNGDTLDDLLIQQSDNLNIIYGAVDLQIDIEVLADPDTPSIGAACGFFSCPALSGFDFDGDGFDDVAITLGDSTDSPSAIVYGGVDGLPEGEVLADFPSDRLTILTGTPRLSSGFVDNFGDVNGDGVDDIYFSSARATVILFATPSRRVAEINLDSLDGSNGATLSWNQTQVSDTFRPFINGRARMADMNGDGIDDYLDGQVYLEGLNDSPIGSAPLAILVRQGPESADFFWRVLSDAEDISGFQVSAGESVLAELPATASSYRLAFNSRMQSLDIRVSSIGADGSELGASIRRIQFFGEGFGLRGEVYGPNLLELFWEAPADDYLVWRDGEVYARVNGQSFLDMEVAPGVTHEYFVTDDVLTGGPASAGYLNSLEGLQRRTNTVVIGPDGGDVVEPGEPSEPVNPGAGDQRPDRPVELTGVVYSSTAAEIFWARVTNVAIGRYDVYRNGTLAGSVQGPSWFDDELEPNTLNRYSVVAVSSSGIGSDPSTTLSLNTANNDATGGETTVAPTGLRGEVYSNSALELFWDRDATGAQTYIVESQGAEIGRTDGTSLYVSGLMPGQTYEFYVYPAGGQADAQSMAARVSLTTGL